MKKKELTSKTFVRMPDGTVVPVSTIYNVGGAGQIVERHISAQQWKEIAARMMKRTGRVLSEYNEADNPK